jgi:hypothetical protein
VDLDAVKQELANLGFAQLGGRASKEGGELSAVESNKEKRAREESFGGVPEAFRDTTEFLPPGNKWQDEP